MSKIEQKQKELIALLDDMNFSTMVDKTLWDKRKQLYKELAALERKELDKGWKELENSGLDKPFIPPHSMPAAKDCKKAEEILEIIKLHIPDCRIYSSTMGRRASDAAIEIVKKLEEYRAAGMPSDEEIRVWANDVNIVSELNNPFIKTEDDLSSFDWLVFGAKALRDGMLKNI